MVFKILSVVVAFVIAKIFINNYGQEGYAIWLLNLAIISYLGVVINGVPGGILKYFAENEVDKKPQKNILLYYDAILLYAFAGILSFLVIYFFADGIVDMFNISNSDHTTLVRMLKYSTSLLVFIWPLYVGENIFQALMRYDTINLYKSSGLILGATLLLICLGYNIELIYLPFFYYLPQLLAMLLLNVRLRSVLNLKVKYKFDLKRIGTILVFIGPLILVELSSLLSYEGEKLMIANRLDMKSLAEYSVVTLVPLNVRAFYGILTISVLPAVFKLAHARDDDGIDQILNKGSRFLFIFLSPVILAVILMGTEILTFFIADGESYTDYLFYFKLLCFNLLILLPYSAFISRVLIGMSRISFILYFTLIINFIKLFLIYFFAELYGIESVLIISILVSLCGGLMMSIYAIRNIQINWYDYYKRAAKSISVFLVVWISSEILLQNIQRIPFKYGVILATVMLYGLIQISSEIPLKKFFKRLMANES